MDTIVEAVVRDRTLLTTLADNMFTLFDFTTETMVGDKFNDRVLFCIELDRRAPFDDTQEETIVELRHQ